MVNAHRDPVTAAGYRRLIDGDSVVISFATVTEMRYGALKAGWGELRRRGLERTLSRLAVVQPDDDLMTVCAEVRDRCERRGDALGQKIHEADRWIASSALHLGVDLVSDDSVFQNIDGLTVTGELELNGLVAIDGTTFAPIRITSDSIGCYAG